MLHITNGESVAGTLRTAAFGGDVLAWNDVLHDGPVPALDSLADLSNVRARFIAHCGWGDYDTVRAGFHMRDQRLAASLHDDEVILWFEHDLYDELQLWQILHWYSHHPAVRLSLIHPPRHLGPMRVPELQALFPTRAPVTAAQLALGNRAWQAFTAPSPDHLVALLKEPELALPYTRANLLRLLEEYPWITDGCTRTERVLRAILATGTLDFAEIFRRYSATEQAVFMGDTSLQLRLNALRQPPLERWIGGVRLESHRWDSANQVIVSAPLQHLHRHLE